MPSTTRFERGDVVLLAFPFSSGSGAKQRPALVLFDSGDQDVLVARVTTAEGETDFDVAIENWKKAGLLAPSTVRLHTRHRREKLGAAQTRPGVPVRLGTHCGPLTGADILVARSDQ